MSRLTKKIEDFKFYTLPMVFVSELPDPIYGKQYCGEAINKLGKLEDLMEKYNIEDINEVDTILNNYRKHWG